jgi:hypothetical protein
MRSSAILRSSCFIVGTICRNCWNLKAIKREGTAKAHNLINSCDPEGKWHDGRCQRGRTDPDHTREPQSDAAARPLALSGVYRRRGRACGRPAVQYSGYSEGCTFIGSSRVLTVQLLPHAKNAWLDRSEHARAMLHVCCTVGCRIDAYLDRSSTRQSTLSSFCTRTVAVRGVSSSSAISPKHSPARNTSHLKRYTYDRLQPDEHKQRRNVRSRRKQNTPPAQHSGERATGEDDAEGTARGCTEARRSEPHGSHYWCR